jgi:hypothetical protein
MVFIVSEAHFGGCACGTTNDERNHGPNCHCSYFWFGGMDQSAEQSEKEFSLLNNIPRSPCGHCHQGTCSYCEPMFTFITNFKIEVEEILSFSSISNSERSAVNMIKVKLDYHFNRYNNYVGHQVRLCNEGGLINRMKKERRLKEKSIHNLLITFDWSMKILDNNCMNGSSVCCVKK